LPEQGASAGAGSQEVGVTSQSLDSSWARGPYKVAGNQAVAMDALSTHVCVLTRVAGSFQGWGEKVEVWPNSVQWNLSSVAQQPGVSAEAYCFAMSKFLGPSYRDAGYGGPSNGICGDWGCVSAAFTAANGTRTVFINGMSGQWEGNCEYLHVTQGAFLSDSTTFRVGSGRPCDLSPSGVWGSFTVGFNLPFKYYPGPLSGTTFESRSTGTTRVVMAPTSDAMCHFTRLEGDFNGDGEYAQIRPELVSGVERWVLKTHHGSGSGVVARARCFLRDQRGN
jgi:hypothetical protein